VNKIFIATGVACVVGSSGAYAQSDSKVTLYGIVDSGYVFQSKPVGGGASVNKITGGGQSGSRFGFLGSEDLGDGMKATFQLESGINLDDGTNTLGALFGRISTLGLETRYGNLKAGRQLTPFYQNGILAADAFSMGLMGYIGTLFSTYPRVNNSISYTTPIWNGLTASGMYAFGEVVGNSKAARSYNGAVNYAMGPVRMAVGYYSQNNATGAATNSSTIVSGSYKASFATFFGAFQAIRSDLNGVPGITKTDTNVNAYSVGARIPFGPHMVIASAAISDDQRNIAGANARATHLALGYTYQLSKRTNLYTSIAHISNKNGASYSVADATTAAYGTNGFEIGMRHLF
jgi:predicted porin